MRQFFFFNKSLSVSASKASLLLNTCCGKFHTSRYYIFVGDVVVPCYFIFLHNPFVWMLEVIFRSVNGKMCVREKGSCTCTCKKCMGVKNVALCKGVNGCIWQLIIIVSFSTLLFSMCGLLLDNADHDGSAFWLVLWAWVSVCSHCFPL
jgi:hypothetical protein